jgi:2-isopropylmalate synthase
VTIFGKSWELHVREVSGFPRKENFRMIRESVEYLKEKGKTVFFDAEHFFDGYRDNPKFALSALEAAAAAGRDCLCLCETNGGMLPFDIEAIVSAVRERFRCRLASIATTTAAAGWPTASPRFMPGACRCGHDQRVRRAYGNADLCSILPTSLSRWDIGYSPRRRPSRV